MKKIIIFICCLIFLSACVIGNFEKERTHLHELGKSDICKKNPQRCIDGTEIDW